MSEKAEKAIALFNKGFNCAQSVLSAFCEQFGMDESLAKKLAGGFGGGIRCGEVCGAVSGAVMVIGLKYGQYLNDDMASKDKCCKITSEFMKKFSERKNTVICRELLGYDIRSTEDKAKFTARVKEVCPNAVETAVLLLEEMGF